MPPQLQPSPQDPQPSQGDTTQVRLPDGTMVSLDDARQLLEVGAIETLGPRPPGSRQPVSRLPEGGEANADLQDAIDLGISGLPLLAGLATGGSSAPVAMGATSLAGIIKSLLQGDDLQQAGLEGLGEAALEGSTRGLGAVARPAARGMMRFATQMASGGDEAARFARRIGAPATENPVSALARTAVDAGTPLTSSGARRASDLADTAFREVGQEASEAPAVHIARQIARPVAQGGRRAVRESVTPETTQKALDRILREVDAFGTEMPVAQAAQRVRSATPQRGNQMRDLVIDALSRSVDDATFTAPLQRGVQADALAEALESLVPRSGLFPGPGAATTRAAFSGLTAAPLSLIHPALGPAVAATNFVGMAPSNLSRMAMGVRRGEDVAPFIAPAIRALFQVAPESQRQIEARRRELVP